MTDDIDKNALVVRSLMMLGVMVIGFGTGIYVTLQAVLANLNPVPNEQRVYIRVGTDLYGSLASMQATMRWSVILAGVLLVGAAILSQRDQVRAWYRGVVQ